MKSMSAAWKHALPSLVLASTALTFSACAVKDKLDGSSTSATEVPRVLSFIDAPSLNLGNVPVNATRLIFLPVSSTGSGIANVTAFTHSDSKFTFNGGTFPGTGGTCTQPIQGNCSIAVLFTAPTSASGVGVYTDTLTVGYTSGGAAKSISMTLSATVAVAANIVINGSSNYSYGSKNVGSTTSQSLTVINTGLLAASSIIPASLSSPFAFKGGTYPGTGGTCTTNLSAGSSCTVVADYIPTAAGLMSKPLTLNYNDGNAAATSSISLSGTGIGYAVLTVTNPVANPYDFGTQTTSAPETDTTFTITNSGGQTATALTGSALTSPFLYMGGSYPGTGGTCGTTLAPSTSCTLVLGFLPTTTGLHTTTLSISAHTGETTRTITQDLRGTGATPANLVISNGPTYDYGSKLVGTSTDFSFTVTNSGGTSATSIVDSGLSAPFIFKGGSYPGTGGTCGTTIAASASCTMIVRYSPTAAGTLTRTPTLTYNDGGASKSGSITVSGTGYLQAILSISLPAVNPYDFGTKTAGAAETDVTFTVANTGNGSATAMAATGIATPFLYKGGSYPGTGGTCGTTLAASSTCTIIFGFLPVTPGSYTGTLTVTANDGLGTVTATKGYSAIAAGPAVLTITNTPTYDYGSKLVGTTTDQTLTVTNTGGSTATAIVSSGLAAPINFKGGTYPGTGGTCSTTLASSGTCTVVVRFTPTAAGAASATLNLAYNDGGNAQNKSIDFTGTGYLQAILSITLPVANPYDFGTKTVGAAETDVTITVSNTGNGSATSLSASGIAAPFLFAGGTYPGTAGTCGTTLAASSTCTMVVGFLPTSTGTFSATLSLSANDGVGTVSVTKGLSAIAISAAVLTLSNTPTYDYGSKLVGTTTDQTITVSNTGGSTATAMAGSGFSAPITYKGGSYPGTGGTCSTTLAATASCTIVVRFTPTAAGAQSKTFSLAYNDGGVAQSKTLGFTGTGYLQAILAYTTPAGNPYDFGTKAVGAAETDVTVTVANTGNGAASSISATGLVSPFLFKGGTYPGTGGNCGATLAASSTCTMIVGYLPTTVGSFSSTLSFSANDGVSTIAITKTFNALAITPASLSISDAPSYDFGNRVVNSNTDHTFTVTNNGGSTATALAMTGAAAPLNYKGGSYPGSGGTCSTSLAASSTCTVVIRFSPTGAGSFGETLVLGYSDGTGTTSTSLMVSGVAYLQASLAVTTPVADPYSFGAQTVGAAETITTFTITNSGNGPATSVAETTLSSPFGYVGGVFPGTGGTCGTTINASDVCTLKISFLPTSTGTFTGTSTLNYADGSGSTVNLTHGVSGSAGTTAALAINNGSTYDFGAYTVGSTVDESFIVTNSGGATATSLAGGTLTAPFTYKDGTYPGTGGSCGTTLGAGATCTIVVQFAPVSAGGFSGTLTVSYNDGVTTASTNRPLVGTGGTVANLSIADGPTYDFGIISKSYTQDHSFTVTNVGGASATALAATALSAPFSFKDGTYPGTGGNCGTTLGASGTCTIVVTYSPTALGVNTDTLTLGYHNSSATVSATRAMTGTGAVITKIVGGAEHTCGMYNTGAVRCWGSNAYGQLGNISAGSASTTPVSVTGVTTATDITAGSNHTCVILASGRAQCWGRDTSGQIGNDASFSNVSTATYVANFTDFTQISAGGDITCAVRSGGTLYCWGDDSEGALGNDAALSDSGVPVAVSGLTGMNSVSVGSKTACAKKSDDTIRCWGSDTSGALGTTGVTTYTATPVTPNSSGSVNLSTVSGGFTNCALQTSNVVRCWGANDLGQLGDGNAPTNRTTGITITNLSAAGGKTYSSLVLGVKHGCALQSDEVNCWGGGSYGQMGNASTADQATPVVTIASGVSHIGMGEYHSCAVLSSGAGYCWGANSSGQLGSTPLSQQSSPVLIPGI